MLRLSLLLVSASILHAQNAEALLSDGVAQFRKGHYTEAQSTFTEVLKTSPADARAITYLDLTRAALGDCGRTVSELGMQARRNPDPELRRLAGIQTVHCLSARNDYIAALPVLADLLDRNPNDPDVLYEASELYNRAYSYTVHELFERTPESYRVNQVSSQILETQGRSQEAVDQLRQAIQRNPAALHLHMQLGAALLKRTPTPELLAEARHAFEAELALNSRDATAELGLGEVDAADKKLADAATHFERALTLRKNFPEALFGLARVRRANQQDEQAVKLLQQALEIAPNFTPARTDLIEVYRNLGKDKEAQREQAELEKQRKAAQASSSEAWNKLRQNHANN